jgi:glycosyltransferase involved in cell wall biosynthesis
MDILYVGTLPPHPGGTAIVGYQLLDGLARRGHRIAAIAPLTVESVAAGDRFAAGHPEIRVARFLVPYFETRPALPAADHYRKAAGDGIRAAWYRTLSETPPDAVIIGRENFAWHVPDLARAAGIPSLLMVHGGTILNGILKNFAASESDRYLDQFRKADRVVSVANHLADRLRGLGLDEVTTIQNGVDSHKFFPRPKDPTLLRQLGIGAEQPTVVHASNLKAVKRPLDIVDSAREVLRQRPDTVYVVVGDGPCRRMMEEACRKLSLGGHFRFVGWVEHDLVPDYINLADMVVMPSESEALAMAYLETLACERVLIASDIAAAREVIEDGETGVLFRKRDVADLTAKILAVAGNPALLTAIGKNARQAAMNYGMDRLVTAYELLIRELAESAQAAVDRSVQHSK